jgi:hypothetical protein
VDPRHDISHGLGESWIPNQLQAKLGILSCPVPFSKCNQVGTLETADYAPHRVLSFHLRPAHAAE